MDTLEHAYLREPKGPPILGCITVLLPFTIVPWPIVEKEAAAKSTSVVTQDAAYLSDVIVPPTVELAVVSPILAHEVHRELACTRSGRKSLAVS